jgi:heme exporter protein C
MLPMFSMQQYLYQFASPKYFYYRTKSWSNWLGWIAVLCLVIGIFWGLFKAPADYQQGDAFRIIYIHVPTAFLSITLYAGMSILAVLLLIWRIKLAGIMLGIVAQLGAVMTLLALLTGSIWGKPMWGTWWIWDARLTSELILFILYIAILANKYAVANLEQGEKLIAVLTLVGVVDLPIIHYSVYWWNTLHQGATLSLFAKPKIALAMLYPLLLTLTGFSVLCLWIILFKTRTVLLLREYRQQWVTVLIAGNSLCRKL